MVMSLTAKLYIAIASVFIVKSVMSNFCIIIVIAVNKGMRTTTNIFIANLAISDIMMGGIILPQMIHDISHTAASYYEGEFACRFVTALPILCITASIYSLVVMAVERYRAICTTKGSMNKQTAKNLCGICWALGLIVSIPTFIEYAVKDEEPEYFVYPDENGTLPLDDYGVEKTNFTQSCSNVIGWTYGVANGVFILTVSYIVPLIMIVVSYSFVVLYITRQAKQQEAAAGEGNKSNFALLKNKMRVIKMLVVVATLFAFSWMPYFILLLISKITGQDGTDEADGVVNLSKVSLSIFSVSYNVYLYLYFTASFRSAFKQLFCPCFVKRTKIRADGGSIVTDQSVVTAATEDGETA